MGKKIFRGIYPALVTPLTDKGTINEREMSLLIKYLTNNGINGLYIGGSTGEGPLLSIEQRKNLAYLVKKCVGNKLPIIVHVGSSDTRTAVDLACHAAEIGLDAVSAVPPYYYKMEPENLVAHYSAIAKASDLPVLVYSIPQLTGVTIGSEIMRHLLNIENVIGLKYTDLNLYEMRKIKNLNNGNTTVFYGNDSSLLTGLIMGADGGIGAFYNIMPKPFVQLYKAFEEGNIDRARMLQFRIDEYISICLKYSSVSRMFGIKEILGMIGIDTGKVTLPLLPLDKQQAKGLFRDLDKANFFEFIS